MKVSRIILAALFLFWVLPIHASVQAASQNQFVNIVNPVRISSYSQDPAASLAAQYFEVRNRNLAATWLLTYDALLNKGINSFSLTMDQSQEIGLFLEVTPLLAENAGVSYNKTDSWHRAGSVFLSGYTQEDRRKLIDAIFKKFKQSYGFYPASVGAWWVDSYSLEYMQREYGITANLTCADQFATDGYQIWGMYWSTPFYPGKLHAGIPAKSLSSKLDIVTIQWAPRDPFNGYGPGPASLFSAQDYQKIDYFQKLVNLYTTAGSNQFGQITVGLEGDFIPQTYISPSFFASQLDIIAKAKQAGSIEVVTMKDFSNWYRSRFPIVSPAHIIQADDFLGESVKSVWYQSPNFRTNMIYNYDTRETKIRDFRTYHDDFQEPYYVSLNRDLNLSINLPSQIDSAGNPDEEWLIFTDQLENIESNDEKMVLNYKKHKIQLTKDRMVLAGDINNIPDVLAASFLIDIEKLSDRVFLKIKDKWNFPKEGLVFRGLTPEGTNFLKQKKVIIFVISAMLIIGGIIVAIFRSNFFLLIKIIGTGSIALLIIGSGFKWYQSNSRLYFVNPAELDALNRLRAAAGRKIVVYDRVCLQCSWHTANMPAVFANKRNYVRQISGKDIVYNSSIFNAKTRPEAKKELEKLGADYIYLVRFEDYVELAPFSPGDLNIEEIYSNANAQIWKVKKE